MSLTLMTEDELRTRVETSLPSDALLQLASDCEDTITAWAGPLVLDGDDLIESVTEVIPGGTFPLRQTSIRLQQPVGEIISITERTGLTDTDLVVVDSDNRGDYRVRGEYLDRANGYAWGEATTIQYVPLDSRYRRRLALVKLVQLELNFQPGFGSQQAGPWSERYGKYSEDKQMILNDVYTQDLFA